MTNPYERFYRTNKGLVLACALEAGAGASFRPESPRCWAGLAEFAREMTDRQWVLLAEAVGVNPPSRLTKTEVVQMFVMRGHAAEAVVTAEKEVA